MNWGNKLVIVFSLFGLLIGTLVYRCMRSSVDLVSKDYYKEELAYQEIINGKNNVGLLTAPVVIRREGKIITFCLPPEMKSKPVSGTVLLYCVANSTGDRKIKMNVDENGCQTITAPVHGTYVVKLRWQQGGQDFYHEETIRIS